MSQNDLPDWVRESLATIGLNAPSPERKLDVIMVNAAIEVGPKPSPGVLFSRMHFALVQEISEARRDFEIAKQLHKYETARVVTKLVGEGLSHNKAASAAEGDKGLFELWCEIPAAQARYQVARDFMKSLELAVSAWQTASRTDYRFDSAHGDLEQTS